MQLTPREKDKLLIAMAAIVARRRLERGVKLNHPEAVALITDYVIEGARDGRSVEPGALPAVEVQPAQALPFAGELRQGPVRERHRRLAGQAAAEAQSGVAAA